MMPERLLHQLQQYGDAIFQALAMLMLGIVVSLGRDMQKAEPDPVRVIVGRAVTTGILALGAGSVLAVIPGLPFLGLLGLAAALASLGTGFLERAFFEWMAKK